MTNMNELMNLEIPSKNSQKIQKEEMAKMALANERQILKKSSIKVRKSSMEKYLSYFYYLPRKRLK